LTADLLVDGRAGQRLEEVAEGVKLTGPGAGPQLGDTYRRIEDRGIGVAELTCRDNVRISAPRDLDQNAGIDENQSFSLKPLQTASPPKTPDVLDRVDRLSAALANADELLHCLRLLLSLAQVPLANGLPHEFGDGCLSASRASV